VFVSGIFDADYVATAVFVEEVSRLFGGFNSVRLASPIKKLLYLLSIESLHMGY
jgi:hypothetical protein